MKIHIFLIAVTFVGALSSYSFADVCKLKSSDKSATEIARSCEALLDTMDANASKSRAFNLCCTSANDYLIKNPIPSLDKDKTKYRVKLGLSVCDTIKDPALQYEHDYCLNQMLYHIQDARILAIADKCSPTGGRAVGGGKRGGANHPVDAKGEHSKDSTAKEDQGPLDPHIDDEAYSKCQTKKLTEYLGQPDTQ